MSHLSYFNIVNILTVTPTLLGDINEHMDAWKTEGKLNPFKDIYDIVFQMIVRMASCKELATDASVVQTLNNLFWKLEKSATPVGLLLPWFPGTAKKNKIQATKVMYEILSHYVEVRRKADIPSADAIDVLLADGLENTAIVEVCPYTASPKLSLTCHSVCASCYILRPCQHGHDLWVISITLHVYAQF